MRGDSTLVKDLDDLEQSRKVVKVAARVSGLTEVTTSSEKLQVATVSYSPPLHYQVRKVLPDTSLSTVGLFIV